MPINFSKPIQIKVHSYWEDASFFIVPKGKIIYITNFPNYCFFILNGHESPIIRNTPKNKSMFSVQLPKLDNPTFLQENAIDFEIWCNNNCKNQFEILNSSEIVFDSMADGVEFIKTFIEKKDRNKAFKIKIEEN